MRKNNRWTRDQSIVVFNLYCKIPFNRASSNNPDIIRTAKLIGRSPNSVKMKIGNFGSFDPLLKEKGIVGLRNVSNLDKQIWEEFDNNWESLAFESEQIIADLKNIDIENCVDLDDIPAGADREGVIRIRINQRFFRNVVLSSYNHCCCVTGINNPELLVSSHIIPWAVSKLNRLNPRNGLCLNALHDKAFDRGLITITPNYKIKISNIVKAQSDNEIMKNYFVKYDNRGIRLPEKFLPKKDFLEYHNNVIFRK